MKLCSCGVARVTTVEGRRASAWYPWVRDRSSPRGGHSRPARCATWCSPYTTHSGCRQSHCSETACRWRALPSKSDMSPRLPSTVPSNAATGCPCGMAQAQAGGGAASSDRLT